MKELGLVALGGAGGAVMRYLFVSFVQSVIGIGAPWGTLAVNVLGSFLMGFLFMVIVEQDMVLAIEARLLLMVGFLGAFTTFSTFSMETLVLLHNHDWSAAVINILLSVGLCLVAVWAGFIAAELQYN